MAASGSTPAVQSLSRERWVSALPRHCRGFGQVLLTNPEPAPGLARRELVILPPFRTLLRWPKPTSNANTSVSSTMQPNRRIADRRIAD
jgi:hypothetical protein